MSGKQFLVLLLLFVFYLLLGAAVFHYIEQPREISLRAQERHEEEAITNLLGEQFNETSLEMLLSRLETYCGKTFRANPNEPDHYKWHFYNAVFFVITVVSTIGYGNLAPTTSLSRILMIFYALLGIPINGILLKTLADYFGHFFLRARDKYKNKMHRHNGMSLAWSILFYFSLGFLVFIICPSFLFMYFEEWTMDQAVYYAFVSLTTIGFGDLVAGQDDAKDLPYTLYKVFLIVWVVFGLGYLFMVLGFITEAMRSKRIAKLSKGLVHKQAKMWNGFVHEMGYVRRVLNELYLLKVKPVYHNDDVSMATLQMKDRSSSCPDLRWLGMDGVPSWPPCLAPGPHYRRQRALSEVLPGRLLARRRSETELARIDRRATFADTAPPADGALDPAELLHEFMNALVNWGGVPPSDEVYNTLHTVPGTALPGGGHQGFPDAEILGSEQTQYRLARQRAKSLAPFSAAAAALAEARYGPPGPPTYQQYEEDQDGDDSSTLPADDVNQEAAANNAEWTWSGAVASKRVHELIRARQSRRRSEAVVRKQQRQDRRLQELHDFHRLQQLEEMRQLAKEARMQQKRFRTRTKSSSAVDTSGPVSPRSSSAGFMQRLAIPQRLKDLGRRRPSLQPQDQDGLAGQLPGKRRSPSYDLAAPPFLATNPYRTHSAGDNIIGVTADRTFDGRRESIFRRNSATVHPLLENTSLAEFLRVLQTVQRERATTPGTAIPAAPLTPGKTRKLGLAGLAQPQPYPNTVFNVFPGLRMNGKSEERRSSLRPSGDPGPGALVAGQGKRRMSFWPTFGTDSTPLPAAPRRKSSAARRLSNFFGGGSRADPPPDQGVEGGGDAPPKSTKKRRFSIWPTLGVIGRGSDSEKAGLGLGAAEDGRVDGGLQTNAPPQIKISYVSDGPPPPPPPPAPREALRRMALTSNLITTSVPGSGAAPPPPPPQDAGGRLRFGPASLSGVPMIPAERGRRPAPAVLSPLAGRRGPSTPSPLSTSPTPFRRRALSESTRTRSPPPGENEADSETISERL